MTIEWSEPDYTTVWHGHKEAPSLNKFHVYKRNHDN